jgi:peptidoglycan L-alanyl-D-glutamate endopeptidase CwlK
MVTAIKDSPIDFSVICGYRNEKDQMKAYADKKSDLKWPKSKHNSRPAMACDIVPYPVDWDDIDRFKILGAHIKEVAKRLEIKIEWGGDWKSRKDYPHFQLCST